MEDREEMDAFMSGSVNVSMPDGSVWEINIEQVARHRAAHYAKKGEFGGSEEESLYSDTLPLFMSEHFELIDWLKNNLNWSDISATMVEVPDTDYGDIWLEGDFVVNSQ